MTRPSSLLDDCWVEVIRVVEEACVEPPVMSLLDDDDCWVDAERVVEEAWVGSTGM